MKLSEYIKLLQRRLEVYGDYELVTNDRLDSSYDEIIDQPEMWERSRIYVHEDTEIVAKDGKFLHINL